MSSQIDLTEQVLDSLQEALKAEAIAIHRYLLHAKMCKSQAYERLAEYYRKESIDELNHAEPLMERILFLKGTPKMTEMHDIRERGNLKEQVEADLALEVEAVSRLNAAVTVAAANDNVSRALFRKNPRGRRSAGGPSRRPTACDRRNWLGGLPGAAGPRVLRFAAAQFSALNCPEKRLLTWFERRCQDNV